VLIEVPQRADVLDLGCGAGLPTTAKLAEHFNVTGIDISVK
jgi:2-polyprenyl-3-methyl-5-hydroxy-6-metoxy-1,4-benzoquinol methylase